MELLDYLDANNIDHWESGKNVSKGWIGINCMFCGDDPSNHLGIHRNSLNISCHRCGINDRFVVVIKKIEDCGFRRAIQIFEQIQEDTVGIKVVPTLKKQIVIKKSVILHKHFTPNLSTPYIEYLIKRRFDPELIKQKYGVLEGRHFGDFKYRLIVPIFFNKKIVSFVGRDITDCQEEKYKLCPNDEAILPSGEILYNLDNCKNNKIIIFEGVTDVWRFGDDTCGLLRSSVTPAQIKLFKTKKITKAILVLDADASIKAKKVAKQLSFFIPEISFVKLLKGDPAKQSKIKARIMKNHLLG